MGVGGRPRTQANETTNETMADVRQVPAGTSRLLYRPESDRRGEARLAGPHRWNRMPARNLRKATRSARVPDGCSDTNTMAFPA